MINQIYERIKLEFQAEKLVMGEGEINSKILLIGEAPGAQEVKEGRPFVGKAGENLNEFITYLGITREDIYITNVVKYRSTKLSPKTQKPINRTPKKNEIESFKSFLLDEIVEINPQIIVTLGNIPLQALFGYSEKIGSCHGKYNCIKIAGYEFKVFSLYHPAAIIYNNSLKEVYLDDLDKLKENL